MSGWYLKQRPDVGVVVSGFDQQLAALRPCPLGLRDVRRRLRLHIGGFRRDGCGQTTVTANLVGPVEQHRDPVVLRGLRRDASGEGLDGVVIDGAAAVRVEGVGDVVVVGVVPARDEEPEAILHDRTAQAVVDVVQTIEFVADPDAARVQLLVDVVGLQAAIREQTNEFPSVLVAAGLRDAVHEHAARLVLGRSAGHLNGDFLRLRLVVVDARALAATEHRIGHHAVDQRPRIARLRPMRQEAAAGPHRARSADVEHAGADGGNGAGQQLEVPARGKRLDQLFRDDFAPAARLHVDYRALARDGDAFLERTDPHLDVDRCREVGFQLDILPHDCVEARQLERHGVHTRTQIDDAVLTSLVRRARFHLLDERGAAGFDRHARKHGAGGVTHDAGDGALGDGDAWKSQYRSKHQEGNDRGPWTHD